MVQVPDAAGPWRQSQTREGSMKGFKGVFWFRLFFKRGRGQEHLPDHLRCLESHGCILEASGNFKNQETESQTVRRIFAIVNHITPSAGSKAFMVPRELITYPVSAELRHVSYAAFPSW